MCAYAYAYVHITYEPMHTYCQFHDGRLSPLSYIYTARLAAERAEVEAEEHHGGGDERPHVLVLVGKVLGDQRHQAHAEEGVGHRVHHLLGERLYIYI